MKSEVGPVVVPEGWDYAAARMRKLEKGKLRFSSSCLGVLVAKLLREFRTEYWMSSIIQ
ncbi:hypothetical protein D1BOALGB6SA_7152 [Olavius sp. associated proteobacterium Delta 1]|nr:hypothetical protein D1BOALGB6SA_7152 [Olavius sp. associated proteobacterium Delta 1]